MTLSEILPRRLRMLRKRNGVASDDQPAESFKRQRQQTKTRSKRHPADRPRNAACEAVRRDFPIDKRLRRLVVEQLRLALLSV